MKANLINTGLYIVTDIESLKNQVFRVTLKCSRGYVPAYYSGQYLEILLQNGDALPFSIACPPTERQKYIELHIQKNSERESSFQLFELLYSGQVAIQLPKGKCHLGIIPDKPLLFLAAGTGFAQVKSMIEFCIQQNHSYQIHLYWGARSPEGFYLPNLPVHWPTTHFNYHPVVSEISVDGDWHGRQGLLFEAVIADKEKLKMNEVYISGSPNMVYETTDALVGENFRRENIHSDVFEYAPRL